VNLNKNTNHVANEADKALRSTFKGMGSWQKIFIVIIIIVGICVLLKIIDGCIDRQLSSEKVKEKGSYNRIVTITNLINRFYEIDSGVITFDGIDIRKIKKDDLRSSLGMVLQDTHLFTGTIAENINYSVNDIDMEKTIEAAKRTNAHDFIKNLKDGYDTVITGAGGELSEGQMQLLSIARAEIYNPPVMILDEATSSIDSRTEKIVQEGMDEIMKGRTTFVIAHRLSTIMNSDVIIVLENGEIIERGDHEDLLEQNQQRATTSEPTEEPEEAEETQEPEHIYTAENVEVTFFGDSTVLSGSEQFYDRFPLATVYGEVGLQLYNAMPQLNAMRQSGQLHDIIVFSLGANGGFSNDHLEQLINQLDDDTKIFLLTTHVSRPWAADVNAQFRQMAETHDNIYLMDWANNFSYEGYLYEPDGIHLNYDGISVWIDFIESQLLDTLNNGRVDNNSNA